MTIDTVIKFFKEDIRGLIIIAILTSIVANLLYEIAKKKILRFSDDLSRKRKIKKLKKSLTKYAEGFTTGYATTSSYRQIALVGIFIIQSIKHIAYALFTTILFVAFLLLVEKPYSWILVIIYAIIITLQYKKIRADGKEYDQFYSAVLGDEYLKLLEKHLNEYLEKPIKDKENNLSE